MHVLPYPFVSSALKCLQSSGVYLFSSLTPEQVRSQPIPLSNALPSALHSEMQSDGLKIEEQCIDPLHIEDLVHAQIVYIGKAKRLQNRLSCYLRAAGPENHKVSHLLQHAKSVLIFAFDSHFEACCQEIFLIRRLAPALNWKSKQPGKLFFVALTRDELQQESLVVGRKRPARSKDLLGFLTSRSDI